MLRQSPQRRQCCPLYNCGSATSRQHAPSKRLLIKPALREVSDYFIDNIGIDALDKSLRVQVDVINA